MILKPQIMPMALKACPSFTARWENHRKLWGDDEAGIYNDLAEFAHFIVDAYDCTDSSSIVAAFGLIEKLLLEGDQEVRDAAGIGFLEDVRNIASSRPYGSAVFLQWLGPTSQRAWSEIEKTWRGKRSLMDVVRAEREAQKKKQ